MKKKVLSISILIFVIVTLAIPINANDNAKKFGLGFSVVTESPEIMFRYKISNAKFDLKAAYANLSLDENGSTTSFIIGLSALFVAKQYDDLNFYVGMGWSFNWLGVSDKSYVDYIFNIAWGSEYYISEHFSVEGEYQLNVITTDDRTSSISLAGARIITTSQIVRMHIYF